VPREYAQGDRPAPKAKPRPHPKPQHTPVERPAPAHRHEATPQRTRLSGPALRTRRLTSRQQRLEDQYGGQFHQQTGRSLRGEHGLMRALLEENIASAGDLRHTMREPGVGDLRRGHKLIGREGLSSTGTPAPIGEPPAPVLGHWHDQNQLNEFADRMARQVKLPPIESMGGRDQGIQVLPGLHTGRDLGGGESLGSADNFAFTVLNELRNQGVDQNSRDAVVNALKARNPGWSRALDTASMAHLYVDDPKRAAQIEHQYEQTHKLQGDPGDITNAIMIGTGIGGVAKVAAGAGAKLGASELLALAAKEAATGGGRSAAAKLAARELARRAPLAAGKGALATGKAVLRPAKTLQRVAAHGPIARVGAGSAVLAAPAMLGYAAARASHFHPSDLQGLNPVGVEAAQAAIQSNGEIPEEQKQAIIRKLGENGHLFTTDQQRNIYLARAQKNGWSDNEHTDDLTILQHSMLGSPSGLRRFMGRALHGAAVLSDIPGGAQAAYGAAAQSVHEGSARPGLEFVQKGFVEPTLDVLQDPVGSFKENPLLTLSVLSGAARTAGGLGGRAFAPGARSVDLPGQGRIDLGTAPRNLVDRAAATARDRFLSLHNAEGNAIQQLAHNRATAFQSRAMQERYTRGEHLGDVNANAMSHRARKAVTVLHPDVQAAIDEALMHRPRHDTVEGAAGEIRWFRDHAQTLLDQTEQKLAAKVKSGDRKGEPVYTGDARAELEDIAKHQRNAVERYTNVETAFRKHKPNMKKVNRALDELGNSGDVNVQHFAEIAGDPAMAGVGERRRYLESLAMDTDLEKAIRAETKAASKAARAETKAHVAKTEAARTAAAQAQAAHAEATRNVERLQRAAHLATPPEQIAQQAVAAHTNDQMLEAAGVTADSAKLRQQLQVFRHDPIPLHRNRKPEAQAKVEAAKGRVGSEFVNEHGEHGIITGVTQVASGRRKTYLFEARVLPKDGSAPFPVEMTGTEVNSALARYAKAIGEPIQRGGSERAGWRTGEQVDVHHPNQPDVYHDVPSQGAKPAWLTSPQHHAANGDFEIGVAPLGNAGKIGAFKNGVYQGYHVVVRNEQGIVYAVPDLVFSTSDKARKFARAADQHEGTAVQAIKHQQNIEREAAAQEHTFDHPNGEAAAQVETHTAPVEVSRHVTPENIAAGRKRVERARAEAEKLRAAAGEHAERGKPVALTISRPVVQAILDRGKLGALTDALKKLPGETNVKVALDQALVPKLRAELKRIANLKATDAASRGRARSAKVALEKLPTTTSGTTRAAAGAAEKAARADHLEQRAAAVTRRLDDLEAALKEQTRAHSGQRAEGARTKALEQARAKVAAAAEQKAKAEQALADALAEKAPDKPDLGAIRQRRYDTEIERLRSLGVRPAMRPHSKLEEGTRSPFPQGGKDRAFRAEARDVFGTSHFEKNTGARIRTGKVKANVDLTLRALGAPVRAKALSDAARDILDKWGTKLPKVPEGANLGPGAFTDARRDIAELSQRLEEGIKGPEAFAAAEQLAEGLFQVPRDASGKVIRFGKDQVVVKAADGDYYLMPADAVDSFRAWFADTMAKYNRPGLLHAITKTWRVQALNSTLTTPINNFLGNVSLALTGGAGPISFARAVGATTGRGKWASVVDPIERGSGLAGTTTGAIRPGAKVLGGRNPVSRAGRGYINFNRHANILAEDYGRLALWLNRSVKEAKRQQFGPVMQHLRRANDETMQMIRDGNIDFEKVHNYVDDFFGNLYKRGKYDRKLFLAVPFHRWFRHMVELSLITMPAKYPKRAVFLQELGQIGEDYRKEHGVFPDWMRGVILTGTELVGPYAGFEGAKNVVQGGISTTGFNPFASASQILGGGVGGGVNPVALSAATLIFGKHVEDAGNLSSSLYTNEAAQLRDLRDYKGDPINLGSKDWFRAGAHEIAGMIPIVTKAFPASGRDDAYIPGYDDKIFGHRLGQDRSRTYAGVEGGTLPPWLEPAETPRHTGHIGPIPIPTSTIGRFFGTRMTPYITGGPAFDISAMKASARAQQLAAKQRKQGGFQRTKNPEPPK
jgi:hypothetical protein